MGHTDSFVCHWCNDLSEPVCNECLGRGGDAEGLETTDLLDTYDQSKVDFENPMEDLVTMKGKMELGLKEFPAVETAIHDNFSAKEQETKEMFDNLHRILNEKQDDWLRELRQAKEDKLEQHKTELTRL